MALIRRSWLISQAWLPALVLLTLLTTAMPAATFVVNSTADRKDAVAYDGTAHTGEILPSGQPEVTLRSAIEAANDTLAHDTIAFDIEGGGPHLIEPLSPLPEIIAPVLIDGWSEPDAEPFERGEAGPFQMAIVLSGRFAGRDSSNGLVLKNTIGSEIRGLVIHSWQEAVGNDALHGHGIVIDGGRDNKVRGCFIGLDETGANARPNEGVGILIDFGAMDTTVGGLDVQDANVISSNTFAGITVAQDSSGTFIRGNYIGPDAEGDNGFAGQGYGVYYNANAAYGNSIGAEQADSGNVISGNVIAGILITNNARYLSVMGNIIGLDAENDLPLPNREGIAISAGAKDISIGHKTVQNVISGNAGSGILFFGDGENADGTPLTPDGRVERVQVINNIIGLDSEGLEARPNERGVKLRDIRGVVLGEFLEAPNVIAGNTTDGIVIDENSNENQVVRTLVGLRSGDLMAVPNGRDGIAIAGSDNVVGGTNDLGNKIAGNGRHGIYLHGSEATGNTISGNLIGTHDGTNARANQGSGIVLDGASENHIGRRLPSGSDPVGTGYNIISGNTVNGILLQNQADKNSIVGNLIGVAADQATSLPNAFGIVIQASSENTIGQSPFETQGNLISGNTYTGIQILGTSAHWAQKNVVVCNYIGTDSGGNFALPNGSAGIDLGEYSKENHIGGSEAEGNLISGNTGYGMDVSSLNGTNREQVIQGNRIGTTVDGTGPLPNGKAGIHLENTTQNWIGVRLVDDGNTIRLEGAGNLISGNTEAGIHLGELADENFVWGNAIGTAANGLESLSNGEEGILIEAGNRNQVGDATRSEAWNTISGNLSAGVRVKGLDPLLAVDNVISGNRIGTNRLTNAALDNAHGVIVEGGATGTEIGTPLFIGEGPANVISGNAFDGLHLLAEAGPSLIRNNYIGTDMSGTVSIPNERHGINLLGASQQMIGGKNEAGKRAGNLVSRQSVGEILLGNANNNTLLGNIVGLAADPKDTLTTPPDSTQAYFGVWVYRGQNNAIGDGTTEGANTFGDIDIGLRISGDIAADNQVQGNYFGITTVGSYTRGCRVGISTTGANTLIQGNRFGDGDEVDIGLQHASVAGSQILGNRLNESPSGDYAASKVGIYVDEGSSIIIGGAATSEHNQIARRREHGIVVQGDSSQGIDIRGNEIHDNGLPGQTGLGIDLGYDGVDTTDPYDTDTGPNTRLNAPVLLAATGSFTNGRILYALPGHLTGDRILRLYTNYNADNSGYGEGQNYIGEVTLSAGNGNAQWLTLPFAVPGYTRLSATATDSNGNTSEFSNTILTFDDVDTDNDSVADGLEDSGLSGWDANGDGTPDREQCHVAGTRTANGRTVLLISDPSVCIQSFVTHGLPGGTPLPSGTNLPVGRFAFTLGGVATGSTATVEIRLSDTITATRYDRWDGAWSAFPDNGTQGAILNLPNRSIVLRIEDGGLGDNDGLANGSIQHEGALVRVGNLPPVLQDRTYFATENFPLQIGNPGVLSGASDPDGDPLHAVVLDAPAHGTVALQPAGGFVFTPEPDWSGSDSFTVRAWDGTAWSAAATITLTVNPQVIYNTPPVLAAQTYNTFQDQDLIVDLPGILASATDANNDPLTAALFSPASNGIAIVSPTGAFSYVPNPGYFGADQFEARVFDGTDWSAPATISITVRRKGLERIYVDASAADDTGDGLSWETAKRTLQAGLDAALPNDEIWIAAGTYTPTRLREASDPRSATFMLPANITLRGGYAGAIDPTSESLPELYPTILTGARGQVDNPADNLYTIITFEGTNDEPVTGVALEGLTLTRGGAVVSSFSGKPNWKYSGGALYAKWASFTLQDVTVVENTGSTFGAIMTSYVDATLNRVIVQSNASLNGSAGVVLGNGSIEISDLLFAANHMGGMKVGGNGFLRRALFADNTTPNQFGCAGLTYGNNEDDDSFLIENVTFNNNTSVYGPAALSVDGTASATIRHATFKGNTPGLDRGVIAIGYNCQPTFANCIIWGNAANTPAIVPSNSESSDPSFVNCIIEGGYTAPRGTATGTITADPFLQPLADLGGFTKCIGLGQGSSAIDAADLANAATEDQRGVARTYGSAPDIGAFESGGPAFPWAGFDLGDIDLGKVALGAARPLELNVEAANLTAPLSVTANGDFQFEQADGTLVSILTLLPSGGSINTVVTLVFAPQEEGMAAGILSLESEGSNLHTQLASAEGVASGIHLFVSKSGSSGNDGLTWATALAHPQQAIDALDVWGGQIWVAAGTYVGSYHLQDGLSLYGGFWGNESTSFDLSLRDFEAQETILSGGSGISRATHVIEINASHNLTTATVLDGLTISGGYADGSTDETRRGGGIYLEEGGLTLRHVNIQGNNSLRHGAGIFAGTNAHLIIEDSFLGGNTVEEAASRGGALAALNAHNLDIRRTRMTDNYAYSGGTLYAFNTPLEIDGAHFFENFGEIGGGLYLETCPTIRIENTTFEANWARGGTSTFWLVDNPDMIVRNSTFSGIHPERESGGSVMQTSHLLLDGVTMVEEGITAYTQSRTAEDMTLTVRNSIIWGGWVTTHDNPSPGILAFDHVIINGLSYDSIAGIHGDFVWNFDPILAPLADNGGFAPTFALHPQSPAINLGIDNGQLPRDQLGTFRPEGMGIDLGSIESIGALPPQFFIPIEVGLQFEDLVPGAIQPYTIPITGSGWVQGDTFVLTISSPFRFEDGTQQRLLQVDAYGRIDTAFTIEFAPTASGNFVESLLITAPDSSFKALELRGTGASVPDRYYVRSDVPVSGDGLSWATAMKDPQEAIDAAGAMGVEVWVAAGTYLPTWQHGPSDDDRGKSFRLKRGVTVYGGLAGTEAANFDLSSRNLTTNVTRFSGELGGDPEVYDDNAFHVFYHPQSTPGDDRTQIDATAILDGVTISGGAAVDEAEPAHQYGGGMLNIEASPVLRHVIFEDNVARSGGGAVYNEYEASPLFENCSFRNNRVFGTGRGGAAYTASLAQPTYLSCEFLDNGGGAGGGALAGNGSSESYLSDVLFRGNDAVNGGAIWGFTGAGFHLLDATFEDNEAIYDGGSGPGSNSGRGAAIYLSNGPGLTMKNGTIRGSLGLNAIYNEVASVFLEGVTFENNEGFQVQIDSPYGNSITNCHFSGDNAISVGDSTVNVLDCSFTGANAISVGGEADVLADRCTFTDVWLAFSSGPTSRLSIRNSLITGGDATRSWPLAQVRYGGTIDLEQCTIAGFVGDEVFTVQDDGRINLRNSILWGADTNNGFIERISSLGDVAVENSIVEGCGGSGGSWNATTHGIDLGRNQDLNPLFVALPDPIHGTPGDFSLQPGSPAIDRAPAVEGLGPLDYLGQARIQGAALDLGAIESSGTLLLSYSKMTNPRVITTNLPAGLWVLESKTDLSGSSEWTELYSVRSSDSLEQVTTALPPMHDNRSYYRFRQLEAPQKSDTYPLID